MDSSTFAIVEMTFFYGLFFAFCLWQLHGLKKDTRKSATPENTPGKPDEANKGSNHG